MDCKDEMVEMESQEAKGRGETLVCRDYLAFKVHKLTECHHNKYSGKPGSLLRARNTEASVFRRLPVNFR